MAPMISAVAFDAIFVQFYNTPFCSARNYIQTGGTNSGFSYDQWSDFLAGGASANAKVYIGLPASPDAAAGAGTFWLNPDETKTIVEDFYDRNNFGGIMLWESTRAEGRIDDGMTYYENVARILAEAAGEEPSPSTVSSSTMSSTASSCHQPLPPPQLVPPPFSPYPPPQPAPAPLVPAQPVSASPATAPAATA